MLEAREAVEFAYAGFDGDFDFVFAIAVCEFGCVRREGLETAVVG